MINIINENERIIPKQQPQSPKHKHPQYKKKTNVEFHVSSFDVYDIDVLK